MLSQDSKKNMLEPKLSGVEYFSDSKKFMKTADGNIAFCTDRSTWAKVFLHGLLLDDHLNATLGVKKIRI